MLVPEFHFCFGKSTLGYALIGDPVWNSSPNKENMHRIDLVLIRDGFDLLLYMLGFGCYV